MKRLLLVYYTYHVSSEDYIDSESPIDVAFQHPREVRPLSFTRRHLLEALRGTDGSGRFRGSR